MRGPHAGSPRGVLVERGPHAGSPRGVLVDAGSPRGQPAWGAGSKSAEVLVLFTIPR